MTWNKIAESMDKYIYAVLLAAVAAIPLQQELAALLAAAAGAGSWALRRAGRGCGPSLLTRLQQLLFYGILLVGCVSLFFSREVFLSAYNYCYVAGQYCLLIYSLLYWGKRDAYSRTDCPPLPLRLLGVLLAVSFLVSGCGILQKLLGAAAEGIWVDPQHFPELKTRVYSTLANPNILGGYLVLVIAYTTVFLCNCRRSGRLWFLLAAADMLAAICLVYTYSRGSWLACGAMLLFFSLCFCRKALLPLVIAAKAALLMGGHQAADRLASVLGGADTSSALRLAYIHSTRAIIDDYPWGVGWYGYQFVYPEYNYYLSDTGVIMYHCHNLFLNITAELGYQGLIVFMFLWSSFVYFAFRLARQDEKRWPKAAGQAYLTASVGIAVGGVTDHVYFNTQLGLLFWTLSILTMICFRYQEAEESSRRSAVITSGEEMSNQQRRNE